MPTLTLQFIYSTTQADIPCTSLQNQWQLQSKSQRLCCGAGLSGVDIHVFRILFARLAWCWMLIHCLYIIINSTVCTAGLFEQHSIKVHKQGGKYLQSENDRILAISNLLKWCTNGECTQNSLIPHGCFPYRLIKLAGITLNISTVH